MSLVDMVQNLWSRLYYPFAYDRTQRESYSEHMDRFSEEFSQYINDKKGLLMSRVKTYSSEQKALIRSFGNLHNMDKTTSSKHPRLAGQNLLFGRYSGYSISDKLGDIGVVDEKIYWDLGYDFPFDAWIESYQGFRKTAGAVHFKFLPEKVLEASHLEKYLSALQDEETKGQVRMGGDAIQLDKDHYSNGRFVRHSSKLFYYVGEFQSSILGKKVHVYAHDCNKDEINSYPRKIK